MATTSHLALWGDIAPGAVDNLSAPGLPVLGNRSINMQRSAGVATLNLARSS